MLQSMSGKSAQTFDTRPFGYLASYLNLRIQQEKYTNPV